MSSKHKQTTCFPSPRGDLKCRDMDEDNGMFRVPHTIGSVLCCKCGIPVQPDAANMCAKCLSSEFDITEGLQKQVIIIHCPDCESYLQPPRTWIKAELESTDLLTFCLNRLKNLRNIVKLFNSEFIWTEPHSKRIKVKLTVQKEVLNVFLQQDQLCESCSRVEANPDQWVAVVQLRQNISHRRTFFYLEQLILKHDAAKNAIKIKQMDHGIDFFFNKRSHSLKFVEFVVEISPICLPPKVAVGLGNFGPLVICVKVSNSISLLDPFTLRQSFLDAELLGCRAVLEALLSSRQLVEYIVLDVEPVSSEVYISGLNLKYVLADAQVARVSDFGKNDTIFNMRTHVGHLLNPGDYALGYDIYGANSNDIELNKYKGLVLPDVSYEEKRQRKKGKPRSWKLKSLNMEVDNSGKGVKDNNAEKLDMEYEQFLRDLEENPDLRFNLSLYRNKEYQPSEMASMTDGEDLPSVPLDELLADLDLSDEDVVVDDDGDA
ncbi:60S ribosomal export protein NMD3 [Striga asiatica]|uniref:60S ribosomal export protein NMD3 n=1 Tax=Striga asiatica TaxID=4170 RepID=A0A5A7QAP0_STRAF|nr:60S ribosomal export protein NMD3 [Striga asiatica]